MSRVIGIWWALWGWHPPVGVWIGILGLLGVLVPLIRDPQTIGKREKALWTFVLFALLLLEVKSVYQDRNEHDAQQAEARERETRSFEKIASGISDAIQQSDKQFRETLSQQSVHFDATMKEEQVNIDEVTGGKSYVVVIPNLTPTKNDTFALDIKLCDKCTHAVPNAYVYLQVNTDSGAPGVLIYHETVVPGPFAMTAEIPITPSRTGVNLYRITVVARNGRTIEVLAVQFNAASQQWESARKIVKDVKSPHYNPSTKMAEGQVFRVLEEVQWDINMERRINPDKTIFMH